MARLPRYAAPGQPQHVIQRGNNRNATFTDEADYLFYYHCLRTAVSHHGCQVHAYVFMPNHVHLLITPSRPGAIGSVMQSVGRRYVQFFNRRRGRTGTLWEGRYRATLIDTARYLLTCHQYIELNPVRAGLVREPAAYGWSSHAANASGAGDSLVTAHDLYLALDPDPATRRSAYRALFRSELDDTTLFAIRSATNLAWALGGDDFREAVGRQLNRRAAPLLVRCAAPAPEPV